METIFNAVPVGLYRTTASGQLVEANPRLAELLRYPSLEALFAVNVTELYVTDMDRGRLLEGLDHHGAANQRDIAFRRYDGSTLVADVITRRVDIGEETFFVGVVSDVSGRKELKARADRFARAAAASGEIIFMTDADGIFTYVNPEFTRVYGYEPDEVIGHTTPRILKSGMQAPEDYQLLWARLLSGQNAFGEFRNRTKDGRVVLVDASANAVTDDAGAITGYVAIQRDITARRHIENALHESEALFRRVFDESPIGMAVIGNDNRFERANAAFCDMVGRPEEVLRTLTYLDITHPEERDRTAALGRALRNGDIESIELEKRYVRPDGTVLWAAVSVRVIRDAAGRPLWTMPVLINLTERHRLELQLRHAQKMEAIGQLAGGIAHDFNNILTAILGYCDLVLKSHRDDAALTADVRQILACGHRAAALTKQLLAFSRKQVMRLEIADINDVLERFHQLVRPILGEDIELSFDLAPGPLPVQCDVPQLEQVTMNLIVNARDAMPNGGVIRVRTAAVTVDDHHVTPRDVMPGGQYVQLVIEDSGTGMNEETKRRLFEPFFTTKESGKGTGLGLSVVYGIVRQLGGFVWVYSEEGRGSTFKLYFPLAEERDASASAHVPTSALPDHGEGRILLVEDDPDVRAFAADVLRRHGYDVSVAGCGKEALAVFEQGHRPDLVVVDMVMPGMTGAELARHIRAQHPNVNVLFTSGYIDQRVRTALDGDADLLEKPFTAMGLLSRVRRSLDRPIPGTAQRTSE